MTEDSDEEMFRLVTNLHTRSDFLKFLQLLESDCSTNGHEWENNSLPEYFNAMRGWSQSMDGYYARECPTMDTTAPSWRLFAEILLAARVYE